MPLETPTLEGAHVRLEPLSLEHLDGLCDVALEPSLWQWTVSHVRTREDLRSYIGAALAERDALSFATIDRASGRVAGSTRFGSIQEDHRRGEIGWTFLGLPWQRTALNTEAKLLMLTWAFETRGWLRVEFKTDSNNARSRAAILRLGAQEEGTLRQHMVCEGERRRDTVYFSILAQDWPTVAANLREKLADS